MYRTLSALAALAMTAGTFALAAPAHAAPADDVMTIDLAGLNPADPADAERIDRRIRGAARDFCGSDRLQPVRLMERAAACEKSMVAEARDSAQLAAARRGTPFRFTMRSR